VITHGDGELTHLCYGTYSGEESETEHGPLHGVREATDELRHAFGLPRHSCWCYILQYIPQRSPNLAGSGDG
jgi:hypothetical protein